MTAQAWSTVYGIRGVDSTINNVRMYGKDGVHGLLDGVENTFTDDLRVFLRWYL